MIGSFFTSLSGISAASKRVDVASSNIVNAFDTGPAPSASPPPVGPSEAARAYSVFQPHDVVQTATADGGTQADVVDRKPASKPAYSPDDPNANKDGLVSRPNVDVASEFVNIIFAQRAYEASIKAQTARDNALGTIINARS